MSTLATYKSLLNEKYGTSSTSFATAQMRTDAINEAVNDIVDSYDVPELLKVASLSLTSGVATIPTDLARMTKMWDSTEATPEYIYLLPEQFDALNDNSANYWTIDYDTSSSTRKIMVRPTSETSVRIRYVKKATTMSSDSDESGLTTTWDDAVAYRAAAILASNGTDLNRYKIMTSESQNAMSRAWGRVKNVGGWKQGSRLRSRFETYNLYDIDGQT